MSISSKEGKKERSKFQLKLDLIIIIIYIIDYLNKIYIQVFSHKTEFSHYLKLF